MIIGIIGSSSIKDYDISEFIPPITTHIITGTEKEVHKIAQRYAIENEISNTVLYPKHSDIKDNADLLRDMIIAGRCDMLIAFIISRKRFVLSLISLCLG